MRKILIRSIRYYIQFLFIFIAILLVSACGEETRENAAQPALSISPDNAGLQLPDGFGALKVVDSIGKPRHIAVTSKGGIYLKLSETLDGKGIYYLEDTDGDGIADSKEGFGDYGGTGIFVEGNYLYATSDEEVFRYGLDESQKVSNPATPDTLVTKLISRRQHASKSITLDGKGNIYVTIGAYSNNCQVEDRTLGSPGMIPCTILDSAGGVWQFKADKKMQSYGDGVRYATGLRNVVGLDWNEEAGQLFVMQHGRDQLNTLYPDLYDVQKSANLPAETMYAINQGDDAGWPYIYYDQEKGQKIQSPEYGGDGIKTGGEDAIDPVAAFPAHLAPNGLLFYTGDMFPDSYKNGAFIAFHGSWNRAPEEQEGFMVAFVPFANGKPSGEWQVFADGFAGPGKILSPDQAKHRPMGLAQGPDGSLYISDDSGGTVYRIIYNGKAQKQ